MGGICDLCMKQQESADQDHIFFNQFRHLIEKNKKQLSSPQLIIQQLRRIVFHPFQSQENVGRVLKDAKNWTSEVITLPSPQKIKEGEHSLYQSLFLTARVLVSLKSLLSGFRNKALPPQEKLKVQQYLSNQGLQFCYGRNLFSQSYASSKNISQVDQRIRLKRFYDYCCTMRFNFFKSLLEFLAIIDVINLEGPSHFIKNPFMRMLQNVKSDQQKTMLVENYAFLGFQELYSEKAGRENKLTVLLPNYTFYKNKRPIIEKMTLPLLHKQYKNYEFLEGTHDYIQWMFPNHYSSGFSNQCYPLNYLQSELFLRDKQLAVSLFISTLIFFDFLGIEFNQNLQLKMSQIKRLKEALLQNRHNHLRLMRLLACLSVTGFRQIALKLIRFLNQLTKDSKDFQQVRKDFTERWQIYGKEANNKAKQMCFLERQEFPTHPMLQQLIATVTKQM